MSCVDESLVDYFIVATKRSDGSAAQLSFVYPPLDGDPDGTEFCENVTMFTFPHSYARSWDERSLPPPPAHNVFTLTDAQGEHLYGASLSYFETTGDVKSLCVLTRRPFYTQMLRYLEQVLLLGLQQARSGSAVHGAVEKALCNLFHEVPVPYRGLSVQLQIASLEIVLERPPFLEFPFEMDPELMLFAFMTVDPKVMLQLYHHVLLEHRVLIVGNDSVLVTAVVETLKALVFPFAWIHVVVPNIPDSLDLSTLLEAPVPFLAGANAAQLHQVAIPSNVVKYDLVEARLVVPSCILNNSKTQYVDSVVLPPLPEASTRLLQRLVTTRLPDFHTQRKELQQKLWDRRIQLQKCCMTSSYESAITPKSFFLVKQSMVHRKMMKLYVELAATLLAEFPLCVDHQTKSLVINKYLEKKPPQARPFCAALAQTAHFHSLVLQHNDYVAGHLPLEDALKLHFIHKTLLSAEKITGNQAEASVAVAMALMKTFVALTPQVALPMSQSLDMSAELRVGEVVFPRLDLDAFGEPRQLAFPSIADDAIHSSIGTFVSPSGATNRRASKDTSDWMQSFLRTMPVPSAIRPSDPTSSSFSRSNNSSTASHSTDRSLLSIFGSPQASPVVPLPAPFKRSRTIDRLKNASPFYRTMTQKALDSTLQSLASKAANFTSSVTTCSSPSSTTRPDTIVRSIWLITTSSCACRDNVVRLTQQLVEQLQNHGSKAALAVTDAYCALIQALSKCGHPSEAKAVLEECLSGSSLVSLATIGSIPHFWKPFSTLLRCYIVNGLVQRAFDLLVQVHLEEEQLLDPSLGTLQFTAQVIGADTETIVERVYASFTCGNLGLCLAPRVADAVKNPSSPSPSGTGCELIAFQDVEPESDDGVSLEKASGLRVHDVVETINGEFVLHQRFQEIILALKQASRPMTVTFVRGLDRLGMLSEGGDPLVHRRVSSSASAASLSSTAAVLDGTRGASSSSKSTPRRDLCDRFGLLPKRGIRITALADCQACGSRLSLTQVQAGWSSNDAHDYTTRCCTCGFRFLPKLCVMLGVMTALYQPKRDATHGFLPSDAKVEHFEYLSTPVIRKELSNLAQKVPLTLLSMKDLREMNPRIYWNIVVKLLSLDVPLDFLELPDMAKANEEKEKEPLKEKEDSTRVPQSITTRADDDGMCELKEMVLEQATRIKRDHERMEDALSRVLKALDQQAKQGLQSRDTKPSASASAGRKGWSLLGTLHSLSPRASSATKADERSTESRHGEEEHEEVRSMSDDDRETDVEDMRSCRTVSVTESVSGFEELAAAHTKKPPPRGSKFMPSFGAAAAPFQRITRTLQNQH